MLPLQAATRPVRCFAWLPTPSKRIALWESDMCNIEELVRGGIRTVSFKELVNQALNASIAGETRASATERLHKCNKEANKELLRIFTCFLGSIVQIRRDDIVARATSLTVAQRSELRHAELVRTSELFPDVLLEK